MSWATISSNNTLLWMTRECFLLICFSFTNYLNIIIYSRWCQTFGSRVKKWPINYNNENTGYVAPDDDIADPCSSQSPRFNFFLLNFRGILNFCCHSLDAVFFIYKSYWTLLLHLKKNSYGYAGSFMKLIGFLIATAFIPVVE